MFKILYDRKEALRYFGAKADDQQAANICDLVYLKLRNEITPRSTYKKLACQVFEDRVVLEDGTELLSRQLARHLQGCTGVVLMAATLGPKVDAALRRLAITEIAQAAAAQAVAAALIETYCNRVEQEIKDSYIVAEAGSDAATGERAATSPDRYKFKWRYSPGYGDWPLTEQKKMFDLLGCAKKIGLTLTDGGMMAPIKSVTAVIGVRCLPLQGDAPKAEAAADVGGCPEPETVTLQAGEQINTKPDKRSKCAYCDKLDCQFRRK